MASQDSVFCQCLGVIQCSVLTAYSSSYYYWTSVNVIQWYWPLISKSFCRCCSTRSTDWHAPQIRRGTKNVTSVVTLCPLDTWHSHAFPIRIVSGYCLAELHSNVSVRTYPFFRKTALTYCIRGCSNHMFSAIYRIFKSEMVYSKTVFFFIKYLVYCAVPLKSKGC